MISAASPGGFEKIASIKAAIIGGECDMPQKFNIRIEINICTWAVVFGRSVLDQIVISLPQRNTSIHDGISLLDVPDCVLLRSDYLSTYSAFLLNWMCRLGRCDLKCDCPKVRHVLPRVLEFSQQMVQVTAPRHDKEHRVFI